MVKQFRRFMDFGSAVFPLRPAWVEIDLARLRNNLRLIRRDLPRQVQLIGRPSDEEMTMPDIATLKNHVSYDVLTDWRLRLRRGLVNGSTTNQHELTQMETAPA